MIRVKEIVKSQRQVLENFSYLGLVQLFNMLVPFITLPYLIKVLGLQNYGKIVLVQTVAFYFSTLIRFGLNLVGAREIALYSTSIRNKNRIFSIITYIKFTITVFIYILLISTLSFLQMSYDSIILYSLAVLISFNELLFPQWFFQGVEKLKYVTITNLIIKTFFLVLIFLVIKEKEDYLLVPLILGMGNVLGGGFSLLILFFNEKVKLIKVSLIDVKKILKEAYPLFLSDIIISIKDKSNIIFINFTLGVSAVSIYETGTKFLNLILMPINIINTAIYPKMAKEKNISYLKKIIKLTFCVVLFLVVLIFIFISDFMSIYSKDLLETVPIIKILVLSALPFTISLALGRNCLVIFNKSRFLLKGMILTVLFYLTIIGVLKVSNQLNSIKVFAIINLMVYIVELLYRYYMCKNQKLI